MHPKCSLYKKITLKIIAFIIIFIEFCSIIGAGITLYKEKNNTCFIKWIYILTNNILFIFDIFLGMYMLIKNNYKQNFLFNTIGFILTIVLIIYFATGEVISNCDPSSLMNSFWQYLIYYSCSKFIICYTIGLFLQYEKKSVPLSFYSDELVITDEQMLFL
ncbi:MAG: hypothetical protein Edafosvirus23_5 [Edafosvirus sp.]|uniref:Transmembrane protein n=1 Tax=Edafosvirus sp. TaxID=2487765 RepID=A0A3G4ZUT8_9VIRU|nr:MAG: hypothetical protein Edafosvirus23_5 [Edafosvirus sp.]